MGEQAALRAVLLGSTFPGALVQASPATTFLEALEERRGEGRAVTLVEPQTPPGTSRVNQGPLGLTRDLLGSPGTSRVDLVPLRLTWDLSGMTFFPGTQQKCRNFSSVRAVTRRPRVIELDE